MVLEAIPLPLREDENGAVRVGGTLESLIWAYRQGGSAEAVLEAFSVLKAADVHAVLAYVLSHPEEIEEYLARSEAEAAWAAFWEKYPDDDRLERLLERARERGLR